MVQGEEEDEQRRGSQADAGACTGGRELKNQERSKGTGANIESGTGGRERRESWARAGREGDGDGDGDGGFRVSKPLR